MRHAPLVLGPREFRFGNWLLHLSDFTGRLWKGEDGRGSGREPYALIQVEKSMGKQSFPMQVSQYVARSHGFGELAITVFIESSGVKS